MIEIQAPERYPNIGDTSIFLAGSIEMGKAFHYQKMMVLDLADKDVVLFNPRRDDWDSSWEQTIDNPQFKEQVEWELDYLDSADIIVLYFDPATKSPISLLELGLHAASGKLVICCPDGFWRKGNVEIVAERHNIPFYDDYKGLLGYILGKLNE